ncbi:MAG: alpha/beta hydrolase [Burkholderiaceae bacterium]
MPAPVPTLPPALSGRCETFASDAGTLCCYCAGPPDSGNRPILLIHSINAAASACEVRPLFDHYRMTRPVYAIDLPGYGGSERSDRFYSPRLMTDAVLAMTERIAALHGGSAIDAIAVSLSSEYLARAAHEHPSLYRAVVLVSATGLNRSRPFYGPPGSMRGKAWLLALLGRAPWSPLLFAGLTRRGVIRFFLAKTWGSKDIDEGLLEYDMITTRQPGAAYAPFHFLSAFLFSADISRIYEQITLPVLLVHGTRGDFVRYPDADRLARIARWDVVVMQTGALPYFEDIAGFAAACDAFVQRRWDSPEAV